MADDGRDSGLSGFGTESRPSEIDQLRRGRISWSEQNAPRVDNMGSRLGLAAIGLLCCAALPAAVLRYALEMLSQARPGNEWHALLFAGFIALDLSAIALLMRSCRHLTAWLFAAGIGLAPSMSLYVATH